MSKAVLVTTSHRGVFAGLIADLVSSGDMTAEQANEWYSAKADQWS